MTAFDQGLLDPATTAAEAASDPAVLAAMVEVELAHLAALGGETDFLDDAPIDLDQIAAEAAAGGNPVIPLVQALRRSAPSPDLVHFGLTSQDVIDSALMLTAHRCRIAASVGVQHTVSHLERLADLHRHTPQVARTLGQQAAPTTVGLRLSILASGIRRTWRHLSSVELPLQLGGSVGTAAVLTDRLGEHGAQALREDVAHRLGLDSRMDVWQVERSGVALLGTALAAVTAALGRLGLEVVQGTRAEIGELALRLEPGEGGSSAMPHKQNPVPAVLLVAVARRAPALSSTLLTGLIALDDRPPGDWHAEWQPLRELLRLLLEAASLAERVTAGLTVNVERCRANVGLTGGSIHAERVQQVLTARIGRVAAAELVRDALAADDFLPTIKATAPGDLRTRIDEVTALDGAIGLSDLLIDHRHRS